MRFFDLHVKFDFKEFRTFGFEGIGIINNTVNETFVKNPNDLSRKVSKKINILSSTNSDLLKKGMKKFDLVYCPGFYLDSVVIRAAAENKKTFEVPISEVLNTSGIKRAYIMNRVRHFLRLCNKNSADYVITSRAKDVLEIKTPSELMAIGEILGLSKDQAIRAISQTPKDILEKVLV